jgi:hypothetical protein
VVTPRDAATKVVSRSDFMGTPKLKAIIIATSFSAALLLVAPASAAPIAIQDLYDPTDVFFAAGGACTGANPDHTATGDTSSAGTCHTLEYTHSLSPEYDPGTS